MAVDWPSFTRIRTLRARGDTLETDSGQRVVISAHGPGVLRLRFGPETLPDYGLLVESQASLATRIQGHPDGSRRVSAGAAVLEIRERPLRIRLLRDGELILESITDAHFNGETRLPAFGHGPQGWACTLALGAGDPVYGLGEKFGKLDRRGELIVSWAEDALGVNTERAYKNMPFAWSPRGWGILVHTPARVIHGIGYGPWSNRSYALAVEDEALDLFLFVGETPAGILDQLTRLTGRPADVPAWSLGTWLSRAYYRTPDEALAAAREIRARRLPCDVITFDGRAWQDTRTRFRFEFDPARFTDARRTLVELKAMDFKICCWESPTVSVHGPLFADLAAKGWLLRRTDGAPYVHPWDTSPGTSPFGPVLTPLPPSGLVDFTDPGAYAWWRDCHAPLFDMGVDVFKADFGEQVPDNCVAANGDSGARLHNVYPLLYSRCVQEAAYRYARHGAMVWARAGWIGSQRVPVQWGGDPQTDWGGLAASIRGGLSWGLCGVPCWSSDVGGFYGPPPEAELYLRWLAQSVFSSHLRFHGIGPREPWQFGAEVERGARFWLGLRERLRPYLKAAIDTSTRTGLPVMRAMPLAFPRERPAWIYETQYLFGPDLLVAPIVEPGGRVELWLPGGTWVDVWTGEAVVGGRALTRTGVPLDRLPVYAAAGAPGGLVGAFGLPGAGA